MSEYVQGYKPESTAKPESLYLNIKRVFSTDSASGLPCGELQQLIAELSRDETTQNISALDERGAVATAAGMYLAGRNPLLHMQNSGFFEASNNIASLLIPCKMPIPIVVSWRGAPGESATQHLYTGKATIPLIESFGLSYTLDQTPAGLQLLKQNMDSNNFPGVMLLTREKFNEANERAIPSRRRLVDSSGVRIIESYNNTQLNRESAIDAIVGSYAKDGAIFSSTGLISRYTFEKHDDPRHFYNAGAFGGTSLIGLGFSLSRPDIPSLVIEGDGSALTDLGAMATIGKNQPRNFAHVILDNTCYDSCSGESTGISERLPLFARDFGYKHIIVTDNPTGIQEGLALSQEVDGPVLITVNILPGGRRNYVRPLDMATNASRFRDFFKTI